MRVFFWFDLCFWVFWNVSDAVIPVNSLELSKVHNQELQSLDKTLKDAEATLSVSLTFILLLSKKFTQTRACNTDSDLWIDALCVKPLLSDFVHPQGQIEVLTVENKALIEKLTAEENRRKELAEKSQVHLLYLCAFYSRAPQHLMTPVLLAHRHKRWKRPWSQWLPER